MKRNEREREIEGWGEKKDWKEQSDDRSAGGTRLWWTVYLRREEQEKVVMDGAEGKPENTSKEGRNHDTRELRWSKMDAG